MTVDMSRGEPDAATMVYGLEQHASTGLWASELDLDVREIYDSIMGCVRARGDGSGISLSGKRHKVPSNEVWLRSGK